jgi:hemolysin III
VPANNARAATMKRSIAEEKANTATHLFWFFVSIVSLIFASLHEHTGLLFHSLGGIVASIGSTLYHHHDGDDAEGKFRLRRMDKYCIFLFMGMTSMGFGIEQSNVWLIYSSVVMIASFVIANLYHRNLIPESSSEIYYLILAFGAVMSASHLVCPRHAIADITINFLLGLVSYGLGYYCYSKDSKLRWMHVLWHVFVFMGWAFHALALINLSEALPIDP